MKIIFIILLIALGPFQTVFAQDENNFYCLSGAEFKIPALSLSTGFARSFKAHFDVHNLIPQNIKISALDTLAFVQDEYLKLTKENLQKIYFLKDSLNAEITFNYIVRSGRNLNKDYAESVSDNEINLVFRKIVHITRDPVICTSPDTVILDHYIQIDKPVEYKKSDILVERILYDGMDSTVILRNNFPELTGEILKLAKAYTKRYILGNSPATKKYFINFSLILRYPECDDFELIY